MIDFVSRSLAWRIALAGQAGGFNPGLAAYGKLFRGTYAPVRGRLPVEIGGAGAMTWEPGSEDRDRAVDFLNSKVIAIAAGTQRDAAQRDQRADPGHAPRAERRHPPSLQRGSPGGEGLVGTAGLT